MVKKKSTSTALREKPHPLSHQLLAIFWKLGPAYARWLEMITSQSGTTPQRLRLLGLLCQRGPMKMCEIRDEMGVSGTNITSLVDALERDGRIVRVPHRQDRRVTLIEITPSARQLYSSKIGPFKDKMSAIFDDFTDAEQKQFYSLLCRMHDALAGKGILELRESREPRESERHSACRKK